MKVYIVTRTQFPNGMAAANRIKCYAAALMHANIECEVVVFTRPERYGVKPLNTIGKGEYKGIPFRYIGGTPLRHRNFFVRRLNDYLDRKNTLRYLRNNLKKGDAVLMYIGKDVDYSVEIVKTAHKCGAFCTKDLGELPFGTSKETESTIKGRKQMLQKLFPMLDGVLAISDTLFQLAKDNCSGECLITKIPILVDYDQYRLEDHSSESKVPYIFHSGTLYEQKDGILGMIEAFGMALQVRKDINLNFICTGNLKESPHSDEIIGLIKKYDLQDKLVFTGYLSNEELKEYLSKASLVIINKYETQQNKYCFSTKLGEYLAASKPVIITNVGEAMNYLTDRKDAYIVEPENVKQLSDAIVEAMTDGNMRVRIAENGQALCKQAFDYRNYGSVLKDHLANLKIVSCRDN